jgi:alkylated DNA nucleotide flippase Atl1
VAAGFAERVWALVRTVPPGRVTTYGEVAEALFGVRKGARGVGQAMARCPADVPWWRVVRADGSTAPADCAAEQRARLLDEGVAFGADGRVELSATGGGPFSPASG